MKRATCDDYTTQTTDKSITFTLLIMFECRFIDYSPVNYLYYYQYTPWSQIKFKT